MSALGRVLRLATPDDAAAILEIYRPFVIETATSFEVEPPTVVEMARRVTTLVHKLPWLVCTENGVLIGYAYASMHRDRAAYQWSVEVSAYVDQALRRSGVARLLYDRLFQILAVQGYYNAFAGITLPNRPSVAFHQALGFVPVGVFHSIGFKFDRWHDVAWFERTLQPLHAPSGPPRSLTHPAVAAQLEGLLSQ